MSRIASRPREAWYHAVNPMEGGITIRFDSEDDPEKWMELFVPNAELKGIIADWVDAQLTDEDWKLSGDQLTIRRWQVALDLLKPVLIRSPTPTHAGVGDR